MRTNVEAQSTFCKRHARSSCQLVGSKLVAALGRRSRLTMDVLSRLASSGESAMSAASIVTAEMTLKRLGARQAQGCDTQLIRRADRAQGSRSWRRASQYIHMRPAGTSNSAQPAFSSDWITLTDAPDPRKGSGNPVIMYIHTYSYIRGTASLCTYGLVRLVPHRPGQLHRPLFLLDASRGEKATDADRRTGKDLHSAPPVKQSLQMCN